MKRARAWPLTLAPAPLAIASRPGLRGLFPRPTETLCGTEPGIARPRRGAADSTPDARDAADIVPTDFCKASSATARTRATHACAWLGACSVPFDQNAFGQCMIDAILAYDCTTNPNHAVNAGARSTISGTRSGRPAHASTWTRRSARATSVAPRRGVRVRRQRAGERPPRVQRRRRRPELPRRGEALRDRRHVRGAGRDRVVHDVECDNTVLHDCEGTSDLGYDCRYFGAGICAASDAGAGCEPSFGNGGGVSCAQSNSVTCAGD